MAPPAPPFLVAYAAMKAGVIRLTQVLADMLGPSNINVNCVCPGFVYTDAVRGLMEFAVATMPEYKGLDPRDLFVGSLDGRSPMPGGLVPLRREQTVEDMARAVVFLVSDDAVNITGQTFNVDGGMVKS